MTAKKKIQISQSPFYKLSNKRKLAELLGTTISYLKGFEVSRNNYNTWEQFKKNGIDKRPVEEPKPQLKHIQKKIHRHLSKIETPEFLMSGKKNCCYITNADTHKENGHVLCMDLASFYQSAQKKYIFTAFKFFFKMSDDVALLLTDLIVIPNPQKSDTFYIPTGSPCSQTVIFWAYRQTFEKINALCLSKNVKFSLYVDDITLSSKTKIPQKLFDNIVSSCQNVELKIKQEKTKKYKPNEYKNITGCITTPKGILKVPNSRRKKIIDTVKKIKKEPKNVNLRNSLKGQLLSAQQIEPDIFPSFQHFLKK